MKKSLKYIVVIVIIILIYYFIQFPNTTKLLVNEVSMVEQKAKKTDSEVPVKSDKAAKPSESDSENSEPDKLKQEYDEKEISYLAAYRETKKLFQCSKVFFDKEKGFNLIEGYINEYNSYTQLKNKPTEIQIQYYQMYIDSCNKLLLDENESLKNAMHRIYDRFEDSTPESDDEIVLSKALEIVAKLDNLSRKIRAEQTGSNLLTEAQKKENLKKSMAISKEIMAIFDRNDGELTDEDMTLMKQLYEERKRIREVVDFEPDTEEITYLQQELIPLRIELKDLFRENQTPDVFLIFADHLLNDIRGTFYFTEDVNQKLGIYDNHYIRNLNKVIVPFIACSLDYPCGPESFISIKHCVEPLGPTTTACGKSIEDYYLDDLISPNQMIDFNNYFNYLMDNYAQI